MTYSIPIPFFCTKLHFHSGGALLSPLSDLQMLTLNESMHQLSYRFRELYQKEILNKGDFIQLLDIISEGDYYKASILIDFAASRDQVSFPEFALEFEYFFKKTMDGYWAIVPALAIETFCSFDSSLEDVLYDAIRLEFLRKKRLTAVQNIVSAVWFDAVELLQKEVQLHIPDLKSLESVFEENQERHLPRVAKLITPGQRASYGRKAELEQFARALKSSFGRNVILVGPTGVGKTALVWELVRQAKKRRVQGNFWETTASVLIKELTGETGWEDNLARLCKELSGGEDVLFVRNLLELFEVGKYQGNEVSMADFLRPYISRGEINLVTECTEEEFSRIQLRNPNFTTFFQIIKIYEPTDGLEAIIVNKVRDIAASRQLTIENEAIKETIRLNRRFTPYAGFPGKPIRFLESILLNHKVGTKQLGRSDIIESFCEETGMPRFIVDPDIPMNIEQVKANFNQNIFGQEQAVESITGLLASVKTALTRTGKPIVSLLFVGPTGVGKTEMAKILAGFMFGNRERMLRFDMSEYADPWSVMRLTGDSYFSDGILTSSVRREPFSVLLFDEIEKAHPDFYDLLLQILGEGRLTDSKGKLVNFCSAIIIMTSNIGAGSIQNLRIGWGDSTDQKEDNEQYITEVRKHFKPELFNRIDQVIPFNALSKTVVRSVVEREVAELKKREGVRFRKMDLFIKNEVLDHLAKIGYHPKYGARQLQRAIRESLIIPLAKQLNLYEYDDQLVVKVCLKQGMVTLKIEADPLALELLLEELDKINYADYASDLRRKVNRLQEGHYFIRLLSELDILEREKNAAKTSFWKDSQKSKQFADHLHFKNRLEEKFAEIESLENELSLACLDLGQYNPSIVGLLKQWENNFLEFKIDLLAHQKPESNKLYLAIYGSDLERILNLYIQLFDRKSFEYTARSIWFREHYFKTITASPNGGGHSSGEQDYYVKQEWSPGSNIIPEKIGDTLYGLEFQLSGTCVAFFMEEEDGLHRWKSDPDFDQLYVIQTDRQKFMTPQNIHRKDFYKGSPRRLITDEHLKDTRLKINREVFKQHYIELILSSLEERFKNQINSELL